MKTLKNKKSKSSLSLLMVSCLIILIFVTFIGNQINFKNLNIINGDVDAQSPRAPASQIMENMRSGTMSAERKLAGQLSELKSRALASLGHSANAFDKFRFGILEGKYSLKMDGEQIKDVSFVDTPESEGSPTRISDRLAFLKNNATILQISSKIQNVSTDIKGRKIIETYRVYLKKDDNREAMVRIELDELDRLYNINLL